MRDLSEDEARLLRRLQETGVPIEHALEVEGIDAERWERYIRPRWMVRGWWNRAEKRLTTLGMRQG